MKSSSSSFSLSSDNWSRPIFGLTSDYKSLSRDEREERDWAHLSQIARRRLRCVHVYVHVCMYYYTTCIYMYTVYTIIHVHVHVFNVPYFPRVVAGSE